MPPSQPPPTSYTIHTPRLTIRTPLPSDAPSFLAYFTADQSTTTTTTTTTTLDSIHARIAKWTAATAAAESAFLGIFADSSLIGFGGFNSLPLTAPLNSEERVSDESAGVVKVLVGDLGVGIASQQQRRGFAREAVCGMVEFAFRELRVGYVHFDTQRDNDAFRGLMRDMGLPETEGSGVEAEDAVLKYAWKGLNYDVDGEMWERIKGDLKTRGKWPL